MGSEPMGISVAEINALMKTAGKPTEGMPNHEKNSPNKFSIKPEPYMAAGLLSIYIGLASTYPYSSFLEAIFPFFLLFSRIFKSCLNYCPNHKITHKLIN
jgi:hypothetical protein